MLGKGGICPEAEGRLYRLFIENMATLDVECKLRMRKGTHLEKISNVQVTAIGQDAVLRKTALNTIMQRIETKEVCREKMILRAQDEKEIKAELLLKCFLDCVDEKLRFVNRGGKRAIQRFSEFFMELCVDKILNVS